MGSAAVVLVLSLAIGGWTLLNGKPQIVPGRIAFFGIEAPTDNADDGAAEVAANTIRTTFAALQLDVAASADTSNIAAEDRLDRALQLRAQYAVSGAATRRGDTVTISILLEDAASRTTIWPAPFEGKAANPEALASRVAALLSDRMVCILNIRSSLRRDDIRIVARLPDACSSIRVTQAGSADRWQALADLAPDSAWVQAGLALNLFLAIPTAVPTAVDDMRRRANEALARAQAIDPDLPEVFSARVRAARDRGGSLKEQEAIFLEGLATGRPAPNLNGQYSALLWGAGRVREAGGYLKLGLTLDPLSAPKILANADYLSHHGGQAAAEAVYAQRHAQFPDGSEWQAHVIAALFHDIGDVDAILADRPLDASDRLAACLGDLARLVRKGTSHAKTEAIKRMQACTTSGAMDLNRANEALAFLGQYDAALIMTEAPDISFRTLFDPTLPAVRMQDGFTELMKANGLIDYWRDSGHPPDFCATENAPVCHLIKPS